MIHLPPPALVTQQRNLRERKFRCEIFRGANLQRRGLLGQEDLRGARGLQGREDFRRDDLRWLEVRLQERET